MYRYDVPNSKPRWDMKSWYLEVLSWHPFCSFHFYKSWSLVCSRICPSFCSGSKHQLYVLTSWVFSFQFSQFLDVLVWKFLTGVFWGVSAVESFEKKSFEERLVLTSSFRLTHWLNPHCYLQLHPSVHHLFANMLLVGSRETNWGFHTDEAASKILTQRQGRTGLFSDAVHWVSC